MKPRTVLVTLEIETDAPLAKLRKWVFWIPAAYYDFKTFNIRQVSASVQQQPETKGRGKRP